MIIMGVDPGGTTGVVVCEFDEDGTRGIVDSRPLSFDDYLNSINDTINKHQVEAIGIEKFTISTRTIKRTRQPDALWLTGATMLAAAQEGCPFHLVTPMDSKNAFADDRLIALDLWTRNRHTRDATRIACMLARRLVPNSV